MRAISLTEPWATLMALDEKRFETRGPTFPKKHLGELAIASSKAFPRKCRALCWKTPFREVLARHDIVMEPSEAGLIIPLPLGAIVAVVEVVGYIDVDEMERLADGMIAALKQPWLGVKPAEHEHDFGNYSDGRTVIVTRNLRRLRAPVPVMHMEKGKTRPGGALGIFTLPPATEAAVRAQLESRP